MWSRPSVSSVSDAWKTRLLIGVNFTPPLTLQILAVNQLLSFFTRVNVLSEICQLISCCNFSCSRDFCKRIQRIPQAIFQMQMSNHVLKITPQCQWKANNTCKNGFLKDYDVRMRWNHQIWLAAIKEISFLFLCKPLERTKWAYRQQILTQRSQTFICLLFISTTHLLPADSLQRYNHMDSSLTSLYALYKLSCITFDTSYGEDFMTPGCKGSDFGRSLWVPFPPCKFLLYLCVSVPATLVSFSVSNWFLFGDFGLWFPCAYLLLCSWSALFRLHQWLSVWQRVIRRMLTK